jgi:hypothetical protein
VPKLGHYPCKIISLQSHANTWGMNSSYHIRTDVKLRMGIIGGISSVHSIRKERFFFLSFLSVHI